MPPNDSQETARVEPGQYLIRHLFILTTAIAAILVAIMPLLRTLATPAQLVIGVDAVIFLGSLFACHLWISWHRRRAVQSAGTPLTRYSAARDRKRNRTLLFIAGFDLVCLVLFFWGPHPEITNLINGPRSYVTWLHAGLHLILVSQSAFFFCWALLLDTHTDVSILEIGSRGIIFRRILAVKFHDIHRWAWSEDSRHMRLHLFLANRMVIHVLASREQQVAIDEHLADNVKS